MKKIQVLLFVAACTAVFSCKPRTTCIDESVQETAGNLLRTEMKASLCDSAVLLVMHVPTGEVRARMKFVSDYSTDSYVPVSDNRVDVKVEPGPIVIPLTVMGSMEETKFLLTDPVDAGRGRLVLHQRTIYDQDVFDKGGYGIITFGQCVTLPSFVGTVQMLEWAFDGKVKAFENRMRQMSLGQPSDDNPFDKTPNFEAKMNAFSLGYYFKLSPTQLLTAWNGLANDGKVMAPAVLPKDTGLVNPSMCKPATIQAMKALLKDNGVNELPETPGTAFLKAVNSVKTTYIREVTGTFCGYFPADKPQYSCLVILYHSESPDTDPAKGKEAVIASGKRVFAGMAKSLMSE
ncbi:MAG TPA: penicillin-binding transpeptidase domain-containing protein [Bacteroidales bacterium]|nr:penicillin-binding transpeptidase domain-containing protein [Bacteroidales bacterium]